MDSVKDLVTFLWLIYLFSSCDFLEIRNGSSNRFFSGDLTPFYVTTTAFDNNTVIFIDFTSDSSANEKGFMAYYTITGTIPREC